MQKKKRMLFLLPLVDSSTYICMEEVEQLHGTEDSHHIVVMNPAIMFFSFVYFACSSARSASAWLQVGEQLGYYYSIAAETD